MKKQKLALSLVIVFVILVAVFAILYLREQGSESHYLDIGQPNAEEVFDSTSINRELKQEQMSVYLQNNISELSPEPEVLGGTFFVTEIYYLDDNTAIVAYEDGHIALKARVNFELESGADIKINSFEVLEL